MPFQIDKGMSAARSADLNGVRGKIEKYLGLNPKYFNSSVYSTWGFNQQEIGCQLCPAAWNDEYLADPSGCALVTFAFFH